MTAPRSREQADPPAPPENRPPRRGVRSSSENVSAAGQLHGLRAAICSLPCLAAAAWLAFGLAALVLAVPAQAQVDPPVNEDTTAPSVTTAFLYSSVSSSSFTLILDEPMAVLNDTSDSEMLGSAFSVTCNDVTMKAKFAKGWTDLVSEDGTSYIETGFAGGDLPRRCSQGQIVGLSYDPSVVETPVLTDLAGNQLAAFTTGSDGVPAFENRSTVAQLGSEATVSRLEATYDGPLANYEDLALTPPFASDTTSYTTYVRAHVDRVRITAYYDNGLWKAFEWLDANDMTIPDLDTRRGLLYAPEVGRNVIKAKLTSEDLSATRTYTVTLFRGGPQAPTITGAVPGDAQVTLSWEAPASDSGITRYEYRYDFDDDGRTGSVARWEPIPDSGVGGANQASYTVTGLNNRWTYTIMLRAANPADVGPSASSDPARPVSVADAALTGLSLGAAGTLLPSFALDRTTYTAEVAHGVEEVTVTPTASNPAATIEYLDASDAALADADPAAGQQVAVAVGDTDIKVKVTSPDGTMTQTYTVTVRRAASGMPWLSVADAEGSEADGVTFTVTLSEAVTEAVTATWTATPWNWPRSDPADDADLTSTTGTVTVTAGETKGTFTVTTENDATDENDQTFRVTLSDPSSNAAISDADVSGATARGTILDDDDPPEISIAGSAAAEGDAVTFTLTLSMPSELPVYVDWKTSVQSDDTATPGTDFTAANGTARVDQGDWIKKINVMALADTDDSEDEETFTVTLSDPRNATLGTKNTAQGTITVAVPNRPTSFIAAPGDEQVELSWAAPASDADITRHEYRHMIPGETYPETWTEIADSAPGSTNEAGFTATGLTNETAYTFELRAVNDGGAGAAAEAGPVTPTPGICDRTEQVKVAILDRLRRIDDCAVVTVANLTWVSYLYMPDSGITSLQSGDFAGLSNLSQLDIFGGSITALPADVFSGLTKLEGLQLYNNELSALPDSVFSGLTALEVLGLKGNKLTTLPANAFSDLTNLEVLNLANNKLTSLPANAFSGLQNLKYLWLTRHELTELPATVFSGLKALMILEMPGRTLTSLPATVFSGLTNLRTLSLHGNQVHPLPADVFSGLTNLTGLNLIDTNLDSFPENVFSDLTNLTTLLLRENNLSSLPDGLLDGLTGLTTLRLEENTSDPLPLTVTVEKVGTDQVRAKVLAAATFAVDIPVTVENGALDGGATVLSVAAGSVEGTPVTVTRTAGTAAAVTVDVDLTTPPSFPTDRPTTPWDTNLAIGGHYGYAFVKAASGLPKEILPVLPAPDAPTGLEAARAGDGNVKLSWDAPESGANITRHEYRYKTGTGAYPETWTDIADSAPGETNEDGYTVTGLTNEIAHTFQLRAVNAAGGGTAVEADPVTPTPGICSRTAKIQEVILAELADVSECAAVTVANLASITGFGGALGLATFGQGITSLEAGDFGGLTALTKLNLGVNDLTTLPAGIFSGLAAIKDILLNGNELTALPEGTFAGITTLAVIDLASNSFTAIPARTFEDLTALTQLDLSGNDLTALPDGLFSGLSALESLSLSGNDLTALPAGLFSGLSALSTLTLYENDLVSLPAGLFSGLTALDTLDLEDNDLTALPDRLFNGLTALESLRLEGNDLTALPDGLLSGLTKLRVLTLGDNPNTGDTLALTVTVEKVGTDQARAKVLAGAPAAVEFTPTVANGSLPTGVTKLAVAAGEVDGTAVTVTRTTGTMAAVTVDIDLSTQPSLASGFTGFTFAKATSGLPATILPDTRSPQNFTAKPGDGQAVLSWDAPASGSGVTRHDYRYKSGTGSYPATWEDIPNSAAGEANEDGYTVPGLTNETVYTFELKRFVGTTESATAESNAVTPTPGICDRTQQVRDGILAELADVAECEAVTVANLAGIGRLDLDDKGIASLEAGDFAGLTGMTALILNDNDLTLLPAGVFSGLTALSSLLLIDNDLTSLPGAVFSGLTALRTLGLHENALTSLPGTVFSGLTSLRNVDLHDNDLTSLPGGLFSGLTALVGVDVSGNDLTSLPDGLFSGLTGLDALALGGNPNAGDTLPLTVTLEKVGEDRVRAKVLAGAPFAVAIPVTPANGTLAGGVTVLTVAAGSVGSAAVTVTRTDGTTDAVTVDVDLSTQPSPPSNYSHSGYTFEKAASGLPAEILPEAASLEPPTVLAATPGDRRAVLAWTPPAPDSGFTRHQYRYRTDGDFGDWTDIPDSGPGGANASRYTVTDLANAVEHTFELRARDAGAGKSDPATVTVEPTGPPRIVSVEVVSGPGLDNGTTYGEGEEIRIEVTFDQPVVVEGDPELALDVGGPRLAGLDSGGGTEVLVFVYVVTEDDADADGVSVGDDALRLDGNDGIRNPAGDDAERTHDGPGTLSGHRVDGERRGDVHDHGEFTHGHSVFNDGKGFYTETYPEHTHEGHEHSNTANGHSEAMRPGEHVHHAQEDPDASRFGPDLRTHGDVEHTHRCFDLKPSCNQGDDYAERGGELGLPIEVAHAHEEDAEPGHRFDWRAFFEEGGSGATVSVADAEAARGEDATLSFEVTLDPAQAFAVRVDYATADGTATAGEDYRETAGVLEIPPGQTRATVPVRIPADGAGDGPELFELRLGSATAATVADAEATGTIRTPAPSTPPEIEKIGVASTPRLSSKGTANRDTYGEGETIRIEVRFDQPVVVEGEPTFALEVGDPCLAVCEADYESGSGTDTLVFAYLVLEVDVDGNGVSIGADPIEVAAGATIRNAADQDADLSHRARGRQRNHKVDGSRSAGSHLSVADAEAHESDGEMEFTVRLEPHGLGIVRVDYATADGTGSKAARAGSDYTETSGTLTFNSLETERTVTVPIIDDTEPDDGERFTLTLSNPDGAALRAGDGEATGTIRNSEPQEALTASFEGMPGEHDGEDAFTFRVAFSADIGISYRSLREDAFAVSGGRVTGGERVDDRRDLFEMTVEPDGGGDVAIALEAGRECAVSGAICTKGENRRPLTNTPAATVAGPTVEESGPAPLTAAFEGMPAAHDGESAFTFRVAFSADIGISYRSLHEDAFEVSGGRVTGGERVDDRRDLFEMTVEPDGAGAVTVTLEAGRECSVSGAICTKGENRRPLTNTAAATVAGPEVEETGPAPLTASFEGMPGEHDGESAFTFRVAFSADIGISYRSLHEDAFEVSGGRVTRGERVDDRRDLFEMTVEPDGGGAVTVTLPAGRECSVSGAICTKGENRRQLANTAAATVAGPAVEAAGPALTASFVDMPSEHDGKAFKLRIALSEEIRMSGRRLRSDVVAVSGGRATKAGRVNRRKDLWKLTVRPDSLAAVTVTLAGGAACDTPAAVCTADGRALSGTVSATVRGPVALSVADARAREGKDPTLDFAVSLSRASSGRVRVDYATVDGSAKAGADYEAASGTLSFAPGETAKTVAVAVLDDAHDEGTEVLVLRLENARGARLGDRLAVGRIENTDLMPAAWLGRFGRTVTDQVLDAVAGRLAAPRAAGLRATFAGQALPFWEEGGGKAAANDDASDRAAMAALREWMAPGGANGERRGAGAGGRAGWRPLSGRELVTGTSFALTGAAAEADGFVSLWGRGALSRFDGREGELTLDGEVTTGLMGADWAAERWRAGLAVGHARGTGGYREGGSCMGNDRGAGGCAGEVEARLTGVWPYAGLELTERLSAWAAAGYGAGELRLVPGGGSPLTADLTMAMGAAGLRGEVLRPGAEGGLALAVKGDTRFTRTESEATKDAGGGKLEAATADVWLVRGGVEGSRRFALGGGASLTPSLEVGMRLDGGDAETGFGTDLGGGLALAAPEQGLTLDLKARGLVAHEASGFREWGASASLAWDPRPGTDRGLALTLRQSWGGSPAGGMDALLGRETLAGFAAGDNAPAGSGRLEAELGYGVAMFDGGFTGTPNLGFALTDAGREYRLGWRLNSARKGHPGFEIALGATRRETANADAEHGVMLRAMIRW